MDVKWKIFSFHGSFCWRPSSAVVSLKFSAVRLSVAPLTGLLAPQFYVFCIKLGFNKHKKVRKPFFFDKISCYIQNGVNAAQMGAQNQHEFFSKSLHWIFLKMFLTDIEMWFKVTVSIHQESSNRINGVNLGPKSTFLI